MQTLPRIKNGPELKGILSRIICRTLVVWGENDKMISANYANKYDEILNKKLEKIENCCHMHSLKIQPNLSKLFSRSSEEAINNIWINAIFVMYYSNRSNLYVNWWDG
jgi:hypothetical protein